MEFLENNSGAQALAPAYGGKPPHSKRNTRSNNARPRQPFTICAGINPAVTGASLTSRLKKINSPGSKKK
jgi:hypothetical protein